MTTRRDLIAGALAAGVPLARLRRTSPPRVQAETTIFYGHPGAETVLVRFHISDVDAPAGRLRVFDRTGRRILGTAGVLASGGRMLGELWLPIRNRIEIISELEVPGASRPVRTNHVLEPLPKWTLHWFIILSQIAIEEDLSRSSASEVAPRIAVLRSIGARINPFRNRDPMTLDHFSFLSQGKEAFKLSQITGLAVSETAIGPSSLFGLRATPRILRAFGISHGIVEPSSEGPDFQNLISTDGTPFPMAFLDQRATPEALGFFDGRDAMSRNVEDWLTRTPAFFSPRYNPKVAVMASTDLHDRLGNVNEAIQEWNGLYAYPRIEVDQPEMLFAQTPPRISAAEKTSVPYRPPPGPTPQEIHLAQTERQRDIGSNSENALLALLNVAQIEGSSVDALAQRIDTGWPGIVVFNPSPFPRTEIVNLPDGSVRLAESVPSHGYAYLSDTDASVGVAVEEPGAMLVQGETTTVRLDPTTGAIASLVHRNTGTEWVRTGSEGLNAIDHCRLKEFHRIRLNQVGTRLIANRDTPGGRVTTTVTVYDNLPWVDIVNTAELPQDETFPCGFSFALDEPVVAWETPLGFNEYPTPVGAISHLRWARVGPADEWHILFRAIDAPYLACSSSGRLVSLSSAGTLRYRIQIQEPSRFTDTDFEFGWGAEPIIAAPVIRPSSGPNSHPMPRFGQLLRTSEGGINIFTVKPADDGRGIVVYLQDTIGIARDVPLIGRLLAFTQAEVVDLNEQTVEEISLSGHAEVNIPVEAFGIVAVRLIGPFDSGGGG